MAKSKTYELMVKIAGTTDSSLKNACQQADKNLAALGTTAKNAGKVIAGAAVAAATAVGTIGVAAIKAAADYETQLGNISTLLTGTEQEVAARMGEIGQEVLDVSNRTGVATDNLTDGMYQVISAFGDSADAAAILETAAKSAAAGNATTTDSINLLSAVTKGYGDTSAEAVEKAADLAFATVRLGQTSFPELAASMGKVIPLAGTLGVEQEQLFGAMATLTGVTGSTAEVVTQLKATMQGFLSPSKNMAAVLESLGYESGQALLESEGLQGALTTLKGAVNNDELAFAGLFSSVEAQTAVLAMAGTQADNLTSKTAEMYEAAGAANTAFERQTDTLAYDIQMIKNLGANFLTELGTNILPYVRELAEAALPVVSDALENIGGYVTGTIIPAAKTAVEWVTEHKDLILALAAGIGAAVAAYKIYNTAVTAYNAVMAVYKVVTAASATGTFTLAGAMTALNLPVLAVVAAIGLVVAAGILLYKNWDTVKQKAAELGQKISAAWKSMTTAVAGAAQKLWQTAVSAWSNVVKAAQDGIASISNRFPVLGAVLSSLWSTVQKVWSNIKMILQNVVSFVQNIFSGNWSGAWQNIVNIFRGIFSNVATIAMAPMNMLANGVQAAINAVGAFLQEKVPFLGAIFTGWGQSISAAIENVKAIFSNLIEFVENVFSGNWSAAWQNIVNIFGNLFGAIVNLAKAPINGVISAINFVLEKINSISVTIPDWVPGVGGTTLGFNIPTIPALAAGGIVTAPTVLEAGEGGEPEAIMPLSKLAAMLDEWIKTKNPRGGGQGGGGQGGPEPGGAPAQPGGTDTIVFSPVFNFYGPATREEAVEAGQVSFAEFKRLYKQMKAEERRKQFSPA